MVSAEITTAISKAVRDNTFIRPEYFTGCKTDGEAIQAAIEDAYSKSLKSLSGINCVLLSGKHYRDCQGLSSRSRVAVMGSGDNTIIHAKAGSTKPVLQLYDYLTEMAYWGNFQIDGEMDSQTNPVDGIFIDNVNGKFTWAIDSCHNIEKILVYHCKGHGVNIPNKDNQKCTSLNLYRVIARNNAGNGFNLGCTDSVLTGCISAGNQLGIYNNGGNNRFLGCKTYWNRNVGFYLDGSSTACVVDSCESQEEELTGLVLKNNYNVTVSGFTSDSHGHRDGATNGNGTGIVLDGCQNAILSGIQILNRQNMAGDIKCALMYVNNPKNCEVTGNINAIDLAKETKPIDLVFNELPVTNRIKLNGVDFGYPNLADSSGRLVRDTDKDGVIDGWTLEMKDSSAKACIDSTDMCQTISIQGLHEFGANINRDYKVNQLDKIGLAAFIKVLGDVVAFVQINWFDSNNVYISNVNGKGSSSLSWDWITLDTTAPVGAVIARVRLVVVPKALGKSGKVYFRNVIIENKTSLL